MLCDDRHAFGPEALAPKPSRLPLDTPLKAAFDTHWGAIADRVGTASALPEDIGRFAAIGGDAPQDIADFVALVQQRRAPVLVAQTMGFDVPEALTELARMPVLQMVATKPVSLSPSSEVESLGPGDCDAMCALAAATKPGPFERRTYVLGTFIGVRQEGRLVAMTGQRMSMPGWTEISAVCVHPCARGQGLAQRLVTAMMGRIYASGSVPFLHIFADNHPALRLYEKLGFVTRAELTFSEFTSTAAGKIADGAGACRTP